MAAAATASVPLRELDDVTECPICAEVLNDARVLPCIHTFCLNCLQGYARSTNPGGKQTCPLCRQEFTVPEGGLTKLPRNYFVEKVLEVKKLASQLSTNDVECDLCSGDKDSRDGGTKGKATVFCADCGQNMCDQCLSYHKKFRPNACHRVINLDKDMKTEDVLRKFPENRCDKHSEETIKLYCFGCKLAVCMMCYVEEHNSHKCSDVSKVADELMKQLDRDIIDLKNTDKECEKLIKKVKGDDKEFRKNSAKTEKAISEEADKMHKLIERCKDEMLEKLSQVTTERCKQMETIVQETELQSVIIRNFIQYGHELKEKGTACDIAKLTSSLRQRANELRKLDPVPKYNTEVSFQGRSSYESAQQAFGELDFDEVDLLTSWKLQFTIQNTGGSVAGVTCLDNDMFIARWGRQEIEVYDAVNFGLKRNLQVPGFGGQPRGLAACSVYRCLYVCSVNTGFTHKISLSEGNEVARWQVGNQPWGLSVNKDHNVIVACQGVHQLLEFTTDGALVREINVSKFGINRPLQADHLPNGNYGVLHQGPGFAVIDQNQGILKSNYVLRVKNQRNAQNARVLANRPAPMLCGFAIDKHQRVFIADQNGTNIIVLFERGNSFQEAPLPEALSTALNQPSCVHFDATRKRLYIGEYNTGRVLCYGI